VSAKFARISCEPPGLIPQRPSSPVETTRSTTRFPVLVHSEGHSVAANAARLMSTAPTPSQPQVSDRVTYDCAAEGCDEERHPETSVKGSYCSQACYLRSRGRSFLNTLRDDHKFCYTCFARLKTIQAPDDEWRNRKREPVEIAAEQGGRFIHEDDGTIRFDATDADLVKLCDPDAVTGYQSHTEHAAIGEKTDPRGDGLPDDTQLGTICGVCGNTTLNECSDVLRQSEDVATIARHVIAAAGEVCKSGQTDDEFNDVAFVRELRRQNRTQENFDYVLAVGRGLEAAD